MHGCTQMPTCFHALIPCLYEDSSFAMFLSSASLSADPTAMRGTIITTSIVGTSAAKITKEESQELGHTLYAALKANPGLEDLKKQLSDRINTAIAAGRSQSQDIPKAQADYQQALFAVMLKIDPNVRVILDKLDSKP